MVFEVTTLTPGAGRTPPVINVIRTDISSEAEAKRIAAERRAEFKGLGVTVDVREKPTGPQRRAFIESPTGDVRFISGEFAGPPPKPRDRSAERVRLARQAQEKAAAGEQISAAERQAFRSSRFELTDPVTGKKTIKTGAELGIQTPEEAAQIGARRRAEKEKEEEPTTRQEFAASLFERQQKEIITRDKGLRVVSPGEEVILSGREDIIARGRVSGVQFEPGFLDLPKRREKEEEPLIGVELFREKAEAQKERQEEFFESPGLQRITSLGVAISPGVEPSPFKFKEDFINPLVQRDESIKLREREFTSKVIGSVVGGFAGFPITLGGTLALTGEKVKLTGEALTTPEISKERIAGELFREAPKRVVTEFKELPPEEKVATALFVATAPFLGGGPIRRFIGKRVTRAKAIKELTPKELAKLERFELSVAELKGVRTNPKKLDLVEVERLSPQAAKALEKVILRRKEDLVVGGSVAQRTQIKGKSRIPEDIDIFTSANKKQLLQEIATELKKGGVERVSVVRGKQITIGGKKAIEVKELSLLKQNIQKVQLPFQPFSSAVAKTPRGVRVLRLGAQAQRKVVGGFGLEQERIRTKDISDLPAILKSLRKAKKASLAVRPTRQLRPFTPIKPISLKGEPSSLLRRRRGEPSLIGGISDISKITRSVGVPSIVKPSKLGPSIPSRVTPSVIKPTPPSVITPADISRITPTTVSQLKPAPTRPSLVTPSRSLLEPVKPIPTPTPKKRVPPGIDLDMFAPTKPKQGFDLLVREGEKRGDKFIKVASNLPKNKALTRGKKAVDNFVEASFKITPSGKTTQLPDTSAPDLSKFRRPKGKTKLPPGTYVEKRKHRIDSTGEVLGLSFFRQKAKGRQPLVSQSLLVGRGRL